MLPVENILYKFLAENNFLILDGAMGTMLQKKGIFSHDNPSQILETFNLTHPDTITEIHQEYINAGSQVIYTNTFGANANKLKNSGYTVEQVIYAGVNLAKKAVNTASEHPQKLLVALDIGPIGELIEPAGSLSFETA